jgi:hypothetical protein
MQTDFLSINNHFYSFTFKLNSQVSTNKKKETVAKHKTEREFM